MRLNSLDSPQAVDDLLARVVQGNFNTLFVNVFAGGKAYYPSAIAEHSRHLPPDFDPLADLLPKAHALGIQVHAWVAVGYVGWPTLAAEPGSVLRSHTDWGMVNACGIPGNWLAPAHPEARRFVQSVLIEVLHQYAVDGIHLDYVRYPGPEWSFDPYSIDAFVQQYSVNPDALRGPTLPVRASFTGNPLLWPDSAQVLLEFDDGSPALLLNAYGAGEVLLFNWNVTQCQVAVVAEIMQRGLQRLSETPTELSLFYSGDLADESYFRNARAWLKSLGHDPRAVTAEEIPTLSPTGVLVAPNLYRISDSLAQDLANFVAQGGGLIFLDGPTPSIGNAHVRALTGMRLRGSHFFREERWLRPVQEHPLLPSGATEPNPELERQWAAFRKETVTQWVREIHQTVKAQQPDLVLSAAVFPGWRNADGVGQDWASWVETGLLDWVMPMAYVEQVAELEPWVAEWGQLCQSGRLIPGLIVYSEVTEKSKSPAQVLDEVALAGTCSHNLVLFDMQHMNQALLSALAKGPFASEAVATSE
ncbi:MAG TPA: family 10 glycosylhydrolase [Anaerolineae bacterium]|nr:family 10 glycosylhydrolase [Anaerolineae bacterium]